MKKIALLPGGFKPPHAGHYNMAKWLATNTDADTVIVKIGAKERDGITREMSLKLWDLYKTTDSDSSSDKLSILPSKHNSPVKDVYDYIETDAPQGSVIYLAMGEKEMKTNDQRFANIHKFTEPKGITFETKLVPPQAGGISGTGMRGFINDNDQYSFFDHLPKHLTPEQKEEAWQIVTTKEVSDWVPGDPVSFEMWTSDWNLKGFGKEYDSNFKNREDAVAHYKPNKAEEWAFKSYAYVAKKIPGFGEDLEEDLYNPKDKVLDFMRSSEWKAGYKGKKDIPRTKNQIHNRQTAPVSWEEGLTIEEKIFQLYEMGGTMNNQEKAKHAKNLKRLKRDTAKQGDQYMEVPSYLKGTLTRKLYENYTPSTALINDIPIPLETMNTPDQQMKGMMGRDSLEGGMLFPYNQVQRRDFHMQDCKISLDIIFINQGKINNIHHNCPPCKQNNCPNYSGLADNVLEFPGGYCKQNNINIGDEVNLTVDKTPSQPPIEMNETRLFSKNWWSNIINEILLTEGGAAGHMAHPFNLPNVNSGKDLKDIFEKSSKSLNTNPGSVKIDGVNSSIRLVDLDGQKQFVMDRGSKKPLDIKGITKADLEDRFKPGHGMVKVGGEVLDMFNEALPSLENDLKKLGAWDDPNILFNMEYVSGKTNVQDYGSNFIAIHGLNKVETKEVQGKRKMLTKRSSSEVSYDKAALQSLLDNLAPIAKKNDFEVYGSVPTEVKGKPNFGAALNTSYTIKSNEGDKTQSLDAWLNELNNIPEEDFIFMSGKKVGAVSKAVYVALLKGDNIDELFESEEDKQKAIEGFTTYLATEKLGDEVLKVLDSPMGSVENHEGVVIRDEKIANVPFKITGKFILGGMVSDF